MTINLPEEIQQHIQKIIIFFPQIEKVWLFGSRANERCKPNSDWDIMVFADSKVLSELKDNSQIKHPNIDLFICYNGDSCESPWPDGSKVRKLSLKEGLKWSECGNVATYKGTKETEGGSWEVFPQLNACKIWEKGRNWLINITGA